MSKARILPKKGDSQIPSITSDEKGIDDSNTSNTCNYDTSASIRIDNHLQREKSSPLANELLSRPLPDIIDKLDTDNSLVKTKLDNHDRSISRMADTIYCELQSKITYIEQELSALNTTVDNTSINTGMFMKSAKEMLTDMAETISSMTQSIEAINETWASKMEKLEYTAKAYALHYVSTLANATFAAEAAADKARKEYLDKALHCELSWIKSDMLTSEVRQEAAKQKDVEQESVKPNDKV